MIEDTDAVDLIAFACSPRRGGNTDMLLEAALDGARERGARIRRFDLRAMTIAPCLHCGGCNDGAGRCVVEDDMQRLYEPLRRADRVILASPIFFMSLTAQAKTMIDRCQPLWVRRNLGLDVAEAAHPRAALYLGVGGSDFPHLFDAARTVLAAWYWTLQIFRRTELTFGEIDARGAIRDHPTALDRARAAGRDLAAWRGD
ncbi:MAG: flavodoxin family protein [Armatimonadota bacterium]|jgi:NAD(P)H-dependent FMN reductase